jgi:hypothetical protein
MKKPLVILLGLSGLLLAIFSLTKLKRRDRVGL